MGIANQQCIAAGVEIIDTNAILFGLLSLDGNASLKILAKLGVACAAIRHRASESLSGSKEVEFPPRLPQTPRAKRCVEASIEIAGSLGDNTVGTEHFLLAILRDVECGGAKILGEFGASYESALRVAKEMREKT